MWSKLAKWLRPAKKEWKKSLSSYDKFLERKKLDNAQIEKLKSIFRGPKK